MACCCWVGRCDWDVNLCLFILPGFWHRMLGGRNGQVEGRKIFYIRSVEWLTFNPSIHFIQPNNRQYNQHYLSWYKSETLRNWLVFVTDVLWINHQAIGSQSVKWYMEPTCTMYTWWSFPTLKWWAAHCALPSLPRLFSSLFAPIFCNFPENHFIKITTHLLLY